ncbi:MAG: phosphatase PAP2 family protein [Ruminococcaceae bacterium]|nr:phosphatase PAP2 family protein [Oscillospiraceae bacterium]
MKKPVVDYREFRLSKINDPRFSHLKLLLGWVFYFLAYFITEKFIPESTCYVIHSKLDDLIPFCEVFVIPYVFWYFLVFGSLLYFLLYNVSSFKKLMIFIIITQVTAMLIYIFFPNCQDMRPEEFTRDNIFTQSVGFLYSVDTNTNVFPSLHVAYSLAIASVWCKEKDASLLWKIFVVVAVILICLSTAFIKQHSVLDGFASLFMCLVIEIFLYRDYYLKKFKKQTSEK